MRRDSGAPLATRCHRQDRALLRGPSRVVSRLCLTAATPGTYAAGMCRLAMLLTLVWVAPAAAARTVQPFPPSFLWGTAISGFQSEMGVGAPTDPTTDWWVWVHDPANIAGGRVSGDLPESGPGFYDLF